MEKALVDVPVLLIFFNRPETFEKVFEKVREARPTKLFLACDGARENKPNDIEQIEKCKKIAENIDWECEVHKRYLDKNVGCGIGPFSAIDWALSLEDKIVILEDDCVPEATFFPYMAELLEKYKDDERIGIISGYNHFKKWECGNSSYFFTKTGATLGWGTWRRVWQNYDYTINSFDDEYCQKLLRNDIGFKRAAQRRLANWKLTRDKLNAGENISWWDHQFGFLKYAQSLLMIVPHHNMIYNIGVGANSTHAQHIQRTKWKIGDVCFMPTEPISFPLRHPKYVICDREYDICYFKKIAYPNKVKRLFNKLKRMATRFF